MSPEPRTWTHVEFGGVKRPKGVLRDPNAPKKPKPKPLNIRNPSWIEKARAALERIKANIKKATENPTTQEVLRRTEEEWRE
jgi:hypothetical protein